MAISPLILASTSKARQNMLRAAGLAFTVQAPPVDEAVLQAKLRDSMTPPETMAVTLAQAKALSVTHQNPEHLVIGADQVLYYQGKILSKAPDAAVARDNLKLLQGKTHDLISAVCVSHKNRVVWSHVERARLTMRVLDDAAIEAYCQQAGAALTQSVGGYELETLGSWLFETIEGDFFTILGLPLLPLQHFLRTQGYGI
jgi:septum formation protein